MPFRESDEAVSVDQAWSDPRHHLEWAGAEPTAVFLAVRSRDQADDLRERTALWCRGNRERWTPCEADEDSADWLRRELPGLGVLWLALWAEEQRVDVLHALNEVRIRLADSRGGAWFSAVRFLCSGRLLARPPICGPRAPSLMLCVL